MRKACFSSAVVAAALLLMAAPAAHAGFYVGGSLGQTSSDLGISSTPTMTVDESDTGYKVFGGYNIMKFFSVEATYVDMAGPSVQDPSDTISFDANGFAVEAMGVLPIGLKFQLFAEYGFFMWDGEATSRNFGSLGSEDGSDPTYGLGFGWNVIPKAQIRVEAERYAIEDMDVDMYSAGFAYRF